MYNTEKIENLGEKLKLPQPVGYRVMVAMPEVNEKTDGGVFIPDELRNREGTASVVGLVVGLGPDAYKDEKRFPNGPYCKEGDFVIFRSYSGTRLSVAGQEFRFVNDDTIEAVVDDPRGIKRAI